MSDIDGARTRVRSFLSQWIARDGGPHIALSDSEDPLVLADVLTLLGDEAPVVEGKDTMMTPSQVAEAFGVDPKTVSRWAKRGAIKAVRTPGGHRRFRRSDIVRMVTPHSERND